MLQPYLDQMVSKLATDCMAQRAQRFFYKDWYAQNYNYCYDHIIQLSTVLSQHPYIKGRRFLWWHIVKTYSCWHSMQRSLACCPAFTGLYGNCQRLP